MPKLVLMIATLSLAMTPILLYAENKFDGKQLHDANCLSCHTPEIYTREDRIVNNYRQLQERVRQCELANELTWFEEEIGAVIKYLNTNYYHFNKNKD